MMDGTQTAASSVPLLRFRIERTVYSIHYRALAYASMCCVERYRSEVDAKAMESSGGLIAI